MEQEDSSMEASRQSLLDVVQDKLKKQGKSPLSMAARIVYVSKLTGRETSCQGVQEFVEKVLNNKRLGTASTPCSGLLMVYPTCCLHILEGRISVIMELLREVQRAAPTESHLKQTVILACTEDIPARAYNSWYATFVDTLSKVEHVDGLDTGKCVNAASAINLSMISLGKMLAGVKGEDLTAALKSLQSFHSDLPTPENILAMVSTEDCPSVDEFLEIYDEPMDIDLDGEKVWPMPEPLHFL
mmetsp:Transcript_25329/g.70845  ORF Transcript_25329/g.70845 Transcript_25329/m.70845 type:complete len:243 (-) Transcript_25329:29-757(-)